MRKTVSCVLVIVTALCVGASGAFADCGIIMPDVDINVSEPAQRAIIAYNGLEELLILQTDVKASDDEKVVQFMPLPSKPRASLASEDCFENLQQVTDDHLMGYPGAYGGRGGYGGGAGQPRVDEGVKIVLSEQVGPHAVTVVKIDNPNHFIRWVKDFFREQDLPRPRLSGDLPKIVEYYLERDIRYFAFNVVEVSRKRRSVRALAYRFKSDELYYPLVVTNLFGGSGLVELFSLTPGSGEVDVRAGLRWCLERGARYGPRGPQDSNTVFPSQEELAGLHADIPGMMPGDYVRLSAVKYEGELRFEHDVKAPLFPPSPMEWGYAGYGGPEPLVPHFQKTWDFSPNYYGPPRYPGYYGSGKSIRGYGFGYGQYFQVEEFHGSPGGYGGGYGPSTSSAYSALVQVRIPDVFGLPFLGPKERVIRDRDLLEDKITKLVRKMRELEIEVEPAGAVPARLYEFEGQVVREFAEQYLQGPNDWVVKARFRDHEYRLLLRGPTSNLRIVGLRGISMDLLESMAEEEPEHEPSSRDHRNLQSEIDVSFRNRAAPGVLSYLQQRTGFRIEVEALTFPAPTVTLLGKRTVEEALDSVCSQAGWTWEIDGRTIRIRKAEEE